MLFLYGLQKNAKGTIKIGLGDVNGADFSLYIFWHHLPKINPGLLYQAGRRNTAELSYLWKDEISKLSSRLKVQKKM